MSSRNGSWKDWFWSNGRRLNCGMSISPTPAHHQGRHGAYAPMDGGGIIARHSEVYAPVSDRAAGIFSGTLAIISAIGIVESNYAAERKLLRRHGTGSWMRPVAISHSTLQSICAYLHGKEIGCGGYGIYQNLCTNSHHRHYQT